MVQGPRADEDLHEWIRRVSQTSMQRTAADFVPVNPASGVAMDAGDFNLPSLKQAYGVQGYGMPPVLFNWYAAQGFIGYQACAILSQNWLIDKVCTMPARDAARKGYKVTVNDGTVITPEVTTAITEGDKKYGVKTQCVEFVRNCRIFGIRIALFSIESDDPEFYTKPFNPDGIKPGSYKGISQVDPYWITPELDMEAAADPASPNYYVPTYWRINGKRYHRSHLVVIKTCEVPDVLKPTYFYGGVPLVQRIYERVYASERTANEAPQMALTKRSTILHVDMEAAAGKETSLEKKLQDWAYYRDNYGVKVLGLEEQAEQFDTALADFDMLIMTQYQLVCAIGEVPATKMLGTTPKGFNSTGEYEESNYHEMLESVQEHDMQPLVERHHVCMIRSDIAPKFSLKPFTVAIEWNELDAETAKEKSDRQNVDSTTAKNYSDAGAIDGVDIRQRLIKDKESGWDGMDPAAPEPEPPPVTIVQGGPPSAPGAKPQPKQLGAPQPKPPQFGKPNG